VQVEYQLEFAQWLVTCPAASTTAADAGWTPEQLLLDAVSTLQEAQERAGREVGDCSSSGSSSGKGLPTGSGTSQEEAAGTDRSRRSRTTADAAGGWSKADAVPWTRQMEQRIRAHVLLSQVRVKQSRITAQAIIATLLLLLRQLYMLAACWHLMQFALQVAVLLYCTFHSASLRLCMSGQRLHAFQSSASWQDNRITDKPLLVLYPAGCCQA